MIDFDSFTKTDMAREIVKQARAQRAGFLHDTGLSGPKLGDPHKEPPSTPPLNPNPRRHDVVAWRHDGLRLDHTRHDTKEAAMEYGKALPWIIYHQWALMDGRDMLEKHSIAIPEGMAIDDNGMPIKQ